jgi:hypothetical protein
MLTAFWTLIRRLRGARMHCPSAVDGISHTQGIADLFASKYKNLYNTNPYTNNSHIRICSKLSAAIHRQHCLVLSTDEVSSACVQRLKRSKHDAWYAVDSENLIHGTPSLFRHVTVLLNACLVHGYFPDAICDTQFEPVFKHGKVSRTDSANYRAIAKGSIFYKLFEILILPHIIGNIRSGDNQFGFKVAHSTIMCTWFVKEIILYYNICRSYVYGCFLDCSKAFDLVDYGRLFDKLSDRGVDPLILRLLYYSYSHHIGCVNWAGTISFPFSIKNGVRQGGVLSPYLFSFYIDDLTSVLRNTAVGCYFGSVFAGVVIYADDIVLLSPSVRGLRMLINATYDFATSHKLSFNPEKSFCIRFHKNNPNNVALPNVRIDLGNALVNWVRQVTHLGNIITHNLEDTAHLNHLTADFYVRVNGLLASIGFVRDPRLLYNIFNSLCCCFYGSIICSLNSRQFSNIHVAWQKSVRRLFHLPRATHSKFLPLITGAMHVSCTIQYRFLSFASTCLRSRNQLIRCVATHALHDHRSLLGSNYGHIARNSNSLSRRRLCMDGKAYLFSIRSELEHSFAQYVPLWRVGFIRELMDYNAYFHDDPCLKDIFEYLCCY